METTPRPGQAGWWTRWRTRWLPRVGWTVLYALVAWGALAVAWVWEGEQPVLLGRLFLGLLAGAFLLGMRFRSTWWGFGPPFAFGLAYVLVLFYFAWTPPPPGYGYEGWGFVPLGAAVALMVAVIPCSLAALAGVWWGQHRQAAAPDLSGSTTGATRRRGGTDAVPHATTSG